MAALEIIALDTATPQLRAPGESDTYLASRNIEVRNSTTAMKFDLYNTFTDASNYERGTLRWESNALLIAAQNAGTGAFRSIFMDSGDQIQFRRRGAQIYRMTNLAFDSPAGNDLGTISNYWGTLFVSNIDGASLRMPNLPTSDPAVAGRLWSNGGVLTVSAG